MPNKPAARPERLTRPTMKVVEQLAADPTAEHYGFDLAVRAGIRTGTIYPILAKLEGLGWLESYWEDVEPDEAGRPRRRFYRLTGAGELAVEELLAEKRLDREPSRGAAWGLEPGAQPS